MRIAKYYRSFRTAYKQSFTDKRFELVAIPTVSPPIYSLFRAEKKKNQQTYLDKYEKITYVDKKTDNNKDRE